MAEEAAATEQQQPQFLIQRTYIKDLSFETPMGTKIFSLQGFQPKMQLDVNTRGNTIGENTHEVVLTMTITAKVEEDTAYIIELQQAGIFIAGGFPQDQLAHMIGAICPNFLFPYAREAIDSIAVKGGFPPLQLAPIDFDAVYKNAQAQSQAEDSPTLN